MALRCCGGLAAPLGRAWPDLQWGLIVLHNRGGFATPQGWASPILRLVAAPPKLERLSRPVGWASPTHCSTGGFAAPLDGLRLSHPVLRKGAASPPHKCGRFLAPTAGRRQPPLSRQLCHPRGGSGFAGPSEGLHPSFPVMQWGAELPKYETASLPIRVGTENLVRIG